MKVIKLLKGLPDGRVVEYHRVDDLIIDASNPTVASIVLGSWNTIAAILGNTTPDARSLIELPNTAEVMLSILENILLMPDWAAGEIIDISLNTGVPPVQPNLTIIPESL